MSAVLKEKSVGLEAEDFVVPFPYLRVRKWLADLSDIPGGFDRSEVPWINYVWSRWMVLMHMVLSMELRERAHREGCLHPVDAEGIIPRDRFRREIIDPFLQRSIRIEPPASSLRWMIRASRSAFGRSKRIPLGIARFRGMPVASASTEFLRCYLESNDSAIAVWDKSWYFTGREASEGRRKVSEDLIREMVCRAGSLGRDHELLDDLEEVVLEQCLSSFQGMANFVLSCQDRLESLKSGELPATFMGVACGDIHEQLVRAEVRARGGTVIAFDHGCGLARTVASEGFRNHFNEADEFVALDRWSAEQLSSLKEDALPPHVQKPTSISAAYRKPYPGPRICSEGARQKRILVTPTVLNGWRARAGECFPDICDIYLTKEVCRVLTDDGFEVTIKPHPATTGTWDYRWLERPGVRLSERLFEKEMRDHAAVVNLCPSSSISWSCGLHGFPTVLLSLPTWRYDPKNFASFGNVIDIVPTSSEESGHLVFSEDELLDAVHRAAGIK